MTLRRYLVACALITIIAITFFWLNVRAETSLLYAFVDRGGASIITRGGSGATTIGYARIQPNGSNTTPAGLAIFGFRQGGVLVSEAGVPASPLIISGRIYAEVNGPVNTGIAIANPNNQPVTISFFFTNASGTDFGSGTKTIDPNSQIANFLNQSPFNSGTLPSGTFTFTSSLPVSVIALRGLTNERGEFLITTLPVSSLSSSSTNPLLFPHFADGSGWTTQVILVNTGDTTISGTVQFVSQGTAQTNGQSLSMTVNGQTAAAFNYSVQRHSSVRLQTSGGSTTGVATGSIRVTPTSGHAAPSGLVIFSYKNGNVTVSEAGVPARDASTAFRLYAEASGSGGSRLGVGSILSGVAIANPAATPITVTFELSPIIGGPSVLNGSATIPGNGQVSGFLDQIEGLQTLPRPFKGVLRVWTASSEGIAVIGFRTRVNERQDFLITTAPPVDETEDASTTEVDFPHFADNGGYTTQFILYSGSAGQQASGVLKTFGQNGQALDLAFAPIVDLEVTQNTSPPAAAIGAPLTYSISITNKGPRDASNIQLTDTLPSAATFDNVSGPCPAPIGNVLSCNVGGLRLGATMVVNVVVRPNSTASLTNTVIVGGSEDETTTSNNRSSISANAAPNADLAITQDTVVGFCSLGAGSTIPTGGDCDNLQFRIGVQNNGPSSAANVIVTDILPTDPFSGLVASAPSPNPPTPPAIAPSQGQCSGVSGGRFTCNLGTLASGGTATINLFAAIDPMVMGRTISNTVSVASTSIVDSVSTNDSTSMPQILVLPATPVADLQLNAVAWSPTAVSRPTTATLTVPFINLGRSTSSSVVVVTTLSGFTGTLTVSSASSTQGTCSIGGPTITCNVGALVPNQNKTITIRAISSGAGKIDAQSTIFGSGGEDDDPSNNTSSKVTVTVN